MKYIKIKWKRELKETLIYNVLNMSFFIHLSLYFYHQQCALECQTKLLILMQLQKERWKRKRGQTIEDKKSLKRIVLQQLKSLKPPPNATNDQAIQCLVRQAEFYTNFLLSKHQGLARQKNVEPKKRGHFEEEDVEIQQLIQQQQHQDIFTRLPEQPSILKGGTLKYYQLVGLNWMISLYESGINGILADDMGLGKTIQTISILAFIREYKKINGPHIIVAPKITLGNWMNQFQKWLPCAKVVKLIATKDQREQILTNVVDRGNFDILVTSFEGVRICLNSLKKIKWNYIVIDQAHKIKNEESQLSQVIRKMHTQCKLLLTGTPLQNNLHELWSLMNFLLPEIFNSSELFDNWFAATSDQKNQSQQQIQKKNVQMISQLHKILKPFMLRRTKLQVEKNLPVKKQIHIYVGLTDVQLKIYKNLLQNRNAIADEKKYYLNLLMQLRKVCNHPYLFPGIEPEGAPSMGQHLIQTAGKLIILDRLLKKLYAEGTHKVLIFSQMTMVLDILQDYCNYRMYNYCRIDGSTDMNSRDSQIEAFMAEGSMKFIFLLSTRAGGLGINLTAADTVIIYDSDFNPQMDLQAMDRAHRIGQKNMVNVYRLITENSVEQKIIERQMIKLKWDSLVIQQQKNTQKNKALTKQQMKEMLQYGANFIFKATNGTMTDEEIDDILLRGQTKTNALNKEVEDKLKSHHTNLVDFSMNSINIFEFMQQDEKKKRQDAQALDEMLARELQAEFRSTRRQKGKPAPILTLQTGKTYKKENKIEKKLNIPEYQFFQQRDKLIEILQKEQDYNNNRHYDGSPFQGLTEEQEQLKQKLLVTGFKNWTKYDFQAYISACQKLGRKNIEMIAQTVNKTANEVEQYAKVFWSRINQLTEKDRILKMVTNGEQKIQNRKLNSSLLEWKASKCYEIQFNPAVYTKFRSKLFSIDADRFIAQKVFELGLNNMSLVRQKIKIEPMFRFDHFLRSRTDSELNKRMSSIYKLFEKEKDNEDYGLDYETVKESKRVQKQKKRQQKKAEAKLLCEKKISGQQSPIDENQEDEDSDS